ncbi:hypothetical protein QR399_02555 [Campylobacter jejuni]|nr:MULTISPECIES: hypothetical protein [Campylobacter]KAJ9733433.1 hypothetical protein QR336_01500 [Campylobacter jejuni]KAJ9776715.1 hypothetical protein QR408_08650 [Campylobacter jejuni]KAJ9869465.1 hypothetical protein QR399_02555 [Campylobacter jejuni]KAJ9878694.1 hypothetical protein QR426_00950 [Campylobacter jejuni]MDP8427144.1 hypothetical protein [Campylobacter jejuni]
MKLVKLSLMVVRLLLIFSSFSKISLNMLVFLSISDVFCLS